VGENGESLTTKPSWLKKDVSSALFERKSIMIKKQGKLKKQKMIKKNIYIEREEEREGAGRPHITIINYNVPPDSTQFCCNAHLSKKGSPRLFLCYYTNAHGPYTLIM